MAKNYNARVQMKNDTAENWAKASNFIPLAGEIIIYSDSNKIKIGDGITHVNDLPFFNSEQEAEYQLGSSFTEWEIGKIASGGGLSRDTAALRTKNLLTSKEGILTIDDGYVYTLYLYPETASDETPLGYWSGGFVKTVTPPPYISTNLDLSTIPEGYPSYRIMIRHADLTTEMALEDADKIKLLADEENYLINGNPITYNSDGLKIVTKPNNGATIWQHQANGKLAYGMDTVNAPVPVWVDGAFYVDGTITAHNTGDELHNRHGCHVIEGFAKNGTSRITFLTNKHDKGYYDKDAASAYYWIGADHHAASYGHFQIGSDVRKHSFLFDRDKMTSYGEIDLRSPITLARINPDTDLDSTYATIEEADEAYEPETHSAENNKCMLYLMLRDADNGAMYFDTKQNCPVIKQNGEWIPLGGSSLTEEDKQALINEITSNLSGSEENGNAFAEWEVGIINVWGANADNNARLRTSTYLTTKNGILSIADGYEYVLYVYKQDGNGGYYSGADISTSGTFIRTELDLSTIPSEYINYRILMRHIDKTTEMTVSDASNIILTKPGKLAGGGADEVYIGTDAPTGGQEIWINPSDDGSEYITADELDGYQLKSEAFSGSYDDLANKPSLFSGSYDDLSNKPTIDTTITASGANAVSAKAVYDYVQSVFGQLTNGDEVHY